MAEYVHKSPDNQARVLLAYFSGMMVRERGRERDGWLDTLLSLTFEKRVEGKEFFLLALFVPILCAACWCPKIMFSLFPYDWSCVTPSVLNPSGE